MKLVAVSKLSRQVSESVRSEKSTALAASIYNQDPSRQSLEAGIENLSAVSLCFKSDCIAFTSSRNNYEFP